MASRSSRDIYQDLLLLRCKKRDLAAWDELVSQWNTRLLYFLRRLLDHEQDAANALQELWLQAFRSIGQLQNGARIAPWLYTIARRAASNHYRRTYARREEANAEKVEEAADDVPDEQLHLENVELVHFGLNQLERPDREVLTLYFLEDLTTQELASVLGIPVGTVKSRLFKARRELRRVLEKELQGHEKP